MSLGLQCTQLVLGISATKNTSTQKRSVFNTQLTTKLNLINLKQNLFTKSNLGVPIRGIAEVKL
jgi:hypothetical protein